MHSSVYIIIASITCIWSCASAGSRPESHSAVVAADSGTRDAATEAMPSTRAWDAGSEQAGAAAPSSKRTAPSTKPKDSVPADDADAGMAEQQPVFSITEPLEVAVELSESDWDKLRNEGRSLPATFSGCPEPSFSGYTKLPAQLTLLGETLPKVELRKKGYIGSCSVFRPSLAIDFDKERRVAGWKRLTLNNNIQDATNAHQCLAYALFERAGLPAPRCGLAAVSVNGAKKGFYTNIEPIKKPFLRRVFGEDTGNLYELEAPSDLIAEHAERIELKNDNASDRSDLRRLIAALQLPDAELIPALEALLDLDQYLTYWALEALLGNWDGLSGHGTNSFLYHATRDDRFHPIPWGADQAFTSLRDVLADDKSIAVFASTQLPKRLWALPDWRMKYQERMRKLLAELWRPDELLTQLHAIADLTQADTHAVAKTEQFIQKQRELVEEELARAEPLPPRVIGIPVACDPPKAASSGLYGVFDATARGDSVFDQLGLVLSARRVPAELQALDIHVHERVIMPAPSSQLGAAVVNGSGSALIVLSFTDAPSQNTVVLAISTPLANYHPGEIKFHGYETFGVLTELIGSERHILGYIGNGSIRFDTAGPNTGDVMQGVWSGELAADAEAP